MKHVFVINPTSGVKDSKKVIPWILDYFDDESLYEIFVTEYPGHATEIANRFTVRDNVCIYSIGGDGTAYEVLNGLNDGVAMAVIPNGTGNDFHRSIYKHKFKLKDMLIQTIEGSIHHIDFGVVNQHRFINQFSVGFDAIIADIASRTGKIKGVPNSMAYVVGVLKGLQNPPQFNVEFQYNGESITKESLIFAVMNGQYYGGGFMPTPDALLSDGLFDVLLIESVPRRTMIPLIPQYVTGKHKKLKQIQDFKLSSFNLKLDKEMYYACDGEIFKDDYFVITMMEKRLPFMMPKGSVYNDSDRE